MKITIIVSVYNIEEYIENCINSILRQKSVQWECILVDDGSKDKSGIICDKFSEEYENIFVIHQNNKGLSGARNTGLKAANGEYVYFVDGDDAIAEDSLNNFSTLINDSKPDVILGHMYSFDKNNVIKPYGKIVKDAWVKGKNGKESFVTIYQKNGIIFMGIRGVYKKEFLINNNLFFNENCRYSEDQEWTPRCFKEAKVIRSNENRDYYYRVGRSGSLMNTIDCKKIENTLLIYDRWYKESTEFFDDDFYICLYKMMIERFWSFYFQYPPILMKSEYKYFCDLMDKRKYYVINKPKKIKCSKKIWIIRLFKAKYICRMCKFWLKIHKNREKHE